jgi:hypothetical protein
MAIWIPQQLQIRLLLAQLSRPYAWRELDIMKGVNRRRRRGRVECRRLRDVSERHREWTSSDQQVPAVAVYLEVGSRDPHDLTTCSDIDMMSANADGRFVHKDDTPYSKA